MMDSKVPRSHPLSPLNCVPAPPTSLYKRIRRRAANQRARL